MPATSRSGEDGATRSAIGRAGSPSKSSTYQRPSVRQHLAQVVVAVGPDGQAAARARPGARSAADGRAPTRAPDGRGRPCPGPRRPRRAGRSPAPRPGPGAWPRSAPPAPRPRAAKSVGLERQAPAVASSRPGSGGRRPGRRRRRRRRPVAAARPPTPPRPSIRRATPAALGQRLGDAPEAALPQPAHDLGVGVGLGDQPAEDLEHSGPRLDDHRGVGLLAAQQAGGRPRSSSGNSQRTAPAVLGRSRPAASSQNSW